MKIVIATDSFKGSLTSIEVAEHIEKGIKKADQLIEVVKIPFADGGEGTMEALVIATKGTIIKKQVRGPLMDLIDSYFGILGDGETAVIEMAAVSGLELVPKEKRNPMETTTFGVGELILAAKDYGCKKIILGIGGSATNDGGMGMAQALGVRFYNAEGQIHNCGGKYLSQIIHMDTETFDDSLKDIEIVVACDVTNPLCGEKGASQIYGKQKGATDDMVEYLDKGLRNYAKVLKAHFKIDILDLPGSGAAGGLGGGIVAFLNGELKKGIEIVIEVCELDKYLKDADLLITGEGQTDYQTTFGKVAVGVASVAQKHRVPVICLSGALGEGYEEVYDLGIDAAFSCIHKVTTLDEAMSSTGMALEESAYALTNLVMKLK